jgi:hypothetical protein
MLKNKQRSKNILITDFKNTKIKNIKNFIISSFPNLLIQKKSQKTSQIIFSVKNDFIFNEMIISVSPKLYKKDTISISAIIDKEEFPFGEFSLSGSKSFDAEKNIGFISADTLKLKKLRKNFDIKIKIKSKTKKPSSIKLINIILSNRKKEFIPSKLQKTRKTLKLNIIKTSQMTQKTSKASDICSPTSISMVLDYYGIKLSPIKIASLVYDNGSKIFGNWIFNTMFVSTKSLFSFVYRFNSIKELFEFLDRKIPIIASITFDENELSNSPLKKTKGHLLVVKGYTLKGDIIVNDPASPNIKGVERIYNQKEFEKVWIENKFGTSYIIVDDIKKLPL